MVLDIIIAAILVLPMAMGLRRGFVYTFIHTLGWIGALIAALFLTDPFAGVLRDSFVGNAVMETVSESIFGYAGSADALFEGLPEIMRGGLTTATTEASEILAELITNAVVSVMSFLIILFGIRLILGFLSRSVARREKNTMLSRGDRYLGLVAGGIKGLLLVFVFLALLVPVANLSQEGISGFIVENLRDSFIAGPLYDSNLLLLITGGIFS